MASYCFPNRHDDIKVRLAYTVSAEFIYALDAYLEYVHESSEDGSVAVDKVRTVKLCAEAALGMVCNVERLLLEGSASSASFTVSPGILLVDNPDAGELIASTARVVETMLEEIAPEPQPTTPPPRKWQLLIELGKEFFLRLAVVTETALSGAQDAVDDYDVTMLRGCLDAAVGMMHELNVATWPEGQEMPARVLIAMRDHVVSWRLECDGPQAVRLAQKVCQAVENKVREV